MSAKIRIEATSEFEAANLAQRIAESQRQDVKTTALEIEAYSADFFVAEGVSEIVPVEPNEAGRIWKLEEIERLLAESTA